MKVISGKIIFQRECECEICEAHFSELNELQDDLDNFRTLRKSERRSRISMKWPMLGRINAKIEAKGYVKRLFLSGSCSPESKHKISRSRCFLNFSLDRLFLCVCINAKQNTWHQWNWFSYTLQMQRTAREAIRAKALIASTCTASRGKTKKWQ